MARYDPSLGWAVALGRAVAIVEAGDHYMMLQPPHVAALAERLRSEAAKEALPSVAISASNVVPRS